MLASILSNNPLAPSLQSYLFISVALFTLGLAGCFTKRSMIGILMCIELMLSAANISLVAFSRFRLTPDGLPDYSAQSLYFFVIAVAAAEVAVALSVVVASYRAFRSGEIRVMESLKY